MQTAEYVHVFLFRCPGCVNALSFAFLNDEANLEGADGHEFEAHCDCGWQGELVGYLGLSHWVHQWGGGRSV